MSPSRASCPTRAPRATCSTRSSPTGRGWPTASRRSSGLCCCRASSRGPRIGPAPEPSATRSSRSWPPCRRPRSGASGRGASSSWSGSKRHERLLTEGSPIPHGRWGCSIHKATLTRRSIMGLGTGRLIVFMLACLVAAGGMGAAIGEAVGGSDSAKALDSIELRKDDRGDEFVDDDVGDDPDGDGTRGADGTRGGVDTGGNGHTVGDGDATWGDDGTRGGGNGDGDLTRGDDGTAGGANTGDGDRTRGDDGTRGGISRGNDGTRGPDNTGDRDNTRGNDGSRGGDNTADGLRTAGHDGTRDGDRTRGNDGTRG